jgi:TRAP-type C4-dicarboxylate transport system substrate-binding protein
LRKKLGSTVETKGLHVAGWWPRTFRQLWNSNKPILSPADLAGLRIRTIDNPLYVQTMVALGARPVPMAWGEVYTALQLKAIDAIEPDLSGGFLARMHEVCKAITRWNYSNDALMVTYNKAFWSSLKPEVQAILTGAAAEAATFKQKLDQSLEAEAIVGLKAAGVSITDLTAEQIAAFRERAQPVWKKFEPTFGSDLMGLLQA